MFFISEATDRRIYWESQRLGLQPLSAQVIDAVVQYYCTGAPVWNFCLRTVVIRLAFSIHLAHYQA